MVDAADLYNNNEIYRNSLINENLIIHYLAHKKVSRGQIVISFVELTCTGIIMYQAFFYFIE